MRAELRGQLILDFACGQLQARPWAVYGHLIGGGAALLLGALQMNAGLRARFLPAHRWMGRTYVLGCAVGGVSGLALATGAAGGAAGRFGFGMLGVTWLLATGLGVARIRAGDPAGHRVWMTRSYALALAAVTLRIYLSASLMAGLPFEQAYPVIAWACWVPNLIVAEWCLLHPAMTPKR